MELYKIDWQEAFPCPITKMVFSSHPLIVIKIFYSPCTSLNVGIIFIYLMIAVFWLRPNRIFLVFF
jgi:hypothetical protein